MIRSLAALMFVAASLPAQSVLVEAEGFRYPGGWVTDQQFMEQMGSAFLLAHGMGVPVADAKTEVVPPSPGTYRVWVRTRDWVAPWSGKGAPGRFQVWVDGKPLGVTFGASGAAWHWQDGGTVELAGRKTQLALRDLTGFDGRCDAILLTKDQGLRPPNSGEALAKLRRDLLKLPAQPRSAGDYDLVVVGGGMAGTAAAISAARYGLKVALVQDRPVLGGNNSSEVRVHLGGNINLPPYPALGAVVDELDPKRDKGNAQPAANYDDEKKLAVVKGEANISLFLSTRAIRVEKSGARIAAVIATDLATGAELRYAAPLFADCTGDGTIGALAGADYRYGRESRAETGESLAPEVPDQLVMGTSVMWYTEDAGRAVAFPETPWAIQFTDASSQHATRGDWNWETGQNRNQVSDFETIRDHGLRAVYGNWAFQKNQAKDKEKYANLRLSWVAYVGGKRESRRLLGDVILTQMDVEQQREFPDAAVTATWSIDLHVPDPKNAAQFQGEEFRTVASFGKKAPYAVPYRCLYSRNVPNLFMAGRNISVTHVALGTVRVMRTTGMMGEVVGMAAAIARKHNAMPRDVYQSYLGELRVALTRGAGKDR
ncbi:MAG: FAD-dependent oxidoreductase [Acidobacteria bacterium]|nr:FAD-dependent oxidoreductase [Acidobacteriota bacterium]